MKNGLSKEKLQETENDIITKISLKGETFVFFR